VIITAAISVINDHFPFDDFIIAPVQRHTIHTGHRHSKRTVSASQRSAMVHTCHVAWLKIDQFPRLASAATS
jgi:hypothetical protein